MQSNKKKKIVHEKFNNKATRDITLITAYKRIKQKTIIIKKIYKNNIIMNIIVYE